MPPVRLGLIGAGRWGRVCLRTLQAMAPSVMVGAVASGNPETAAIVAPGCPVFPDGLALLDSGTCDAVVITTPTATHVPVALAALERGVPAFIEKPLCTDSDLAESFRKAARTADVPVMVDHIHLFNPPFRRLVEMAGQLGPVLSIAGVAGKPDAVRDDTSVLWDWGPHDVSMCLKLMQANPDGVTARVVDRPAMSAGRGEVVQLDLRFGGVSARLMMGSLDPRRRSLTVVCRGGTLVYDDLAPAKLTLDGEPVPVGTTAPLSVALIEFSAAVAAGKVDRSSLDLAVDVVKVLARAEQSMR